MNRKERRIAAKTARKARKGKIWFPRSERWRGYRKSIKNGTWRTVMQTKPDLLR
jgi:hypothetical protein